MFDFAVTVAEFLPYNMDELDGKGQNVLLKKLLANSKAAQSARAGLPFDQDGSESNSPFKTSEVSF